MRCALMLRHGRAGDRQCLYRIRVFCTHTHDRLATAGHTKHRHDRPSGKGSNALPVRAALPAAYAGPARSMFRKDVSSVGKSIGFVCHWTPVRIRHVAVLESSVVEHRSVTPTVAGSIPAPKPRERKLPQQEAPRAAPAVSSRTMSHRRRSGSHAGSSPQAWADDRRQAVGSPCRGRRRSPRGRRDGPASPPPGALPPY